MITSTNGNTKFYNATGPQILAHILLLQQKHRLPDWVQLEIRLGSASADLRFAAPSDIEPWAVALSKDPKDISRSSRTDGSVRAWIVAKLGDWTIDCEGATESTALDAEAVAGLESVAAGPVPAGLTQFEAEVAETAVIKAEQIGGWSPQEEAALRRVRAVLCRSLTGADPEPEAATPVHVAVSESRCSCGWEVDGFTAPELIAEKLALHFDSVAVTR